MNKNLTARVIFSFIMSMCMALLMSGWVNLINIGFVPGYFKVWIISFLYAWPVAFTVVLILAPLVNRLIIKIVKD